MISLDLMTLRISSITKELTHTGKVSKGTPLARPMAQRTLFPDEAVVPVVGVVGVSRDSAAAIPDDPKVELCAEVSASAHRKAPIASVTNLGTRGRSGQNARSCPVLVSVGELKSGHTTTH